MLQTKVIEKIKTHILCSITLSRKSFRLWDNEKNMVEGDTAHALCMLDISGYRQTLRIKLKVKVALWGLSTPRPLGSIIYLPQQVPAFISRGATHHTDARDLYQRRRELLPILLADPEFTKYDRIFYMPQCRDMGHIILLPLRRKTY
jgi:hypothetical protein